MISVFINIRNKLFICFVLVIIRSLVRKGTTFFLYMQVFIYFLLNKLFLLPVSKQYIAIYRILVVHSQLGVCKDLLLYTDQ